MQTETCFLTLSYVAICQKKGSNWTLLCEVSQGARADLKTGSFRKGQEVLPHPSLVSTSSTGTSSGTCPSSHKASRELSFFSLCRFSSACGVRQSQHLHKERGRSTQVEARSRDGIASASSSELLNSPQVAGGGEPHLRRCLEKWKVNSWLQEGVWVWRDRTERVTEQKVQCKGKKQPDATESRVGQLDGMDRAVRAGGEKHRKSEGLRVGRRLEGSNTECKLDLGERE